MVAHKETLIDTVTRQTISTTQRPEWTFLNYAFDRLISLVSTLVAFQHFPDGLIVFLKNMQSFIPFYVERLCFPTQKLPDFIIQTSCIESHEIQTNFEARETGKEKFFNTKRAPSKQASIWISNFYDSRALSSSDWKSFVSSASLYFFYHKLFSCWNVIYSIW